MDKNPGLMPLGDILKQAIPKSQRPRLEAAVRSLKPLSRVQSRLLEPCPEQAQEIAFQHSVLCQTSLPYRNPGDDVRVWKRMQGRAMLLIRAGELLQPRTGICANLRRVVGKEKIHLQGSAA